MCQPRSNRVPAISSVIIWIKRFAFVIAATLIFLAAQRHCFAGSAAWGTNPLNGDWNTAANWTPNTVPNGPADMASFATSTVTQVYLSGLIEVASLNFGSDADAFTITTVPGPTSGTVLFITGSGITNASGQVQRFSTEFNDTFTSGIYFENNATAGNMTTFGGAGGLFVFYDSASAGSATFDVTSGGIFQASMDFWDDTTAADATITASDFAQVNLNGYATAANAVFSLTTGAFLFFGSNSTADNAIAACIGGNGIYGSSIEFHEFATAAQGQFTAEGATASGEAGSYIHFHDSTTAANGIFVINGGSGQDLAGAVLNFFDNSTAANATVTANTGVSGGEGGAIVFEGRSRGGTASISVFGNGKLDIGNSGATRGVTIGSLAGDGSVFLGAKALTIGSNNQSTTFSGVIQESGSLTKIGTGALTLTGANTYTGTTTVSTGVLEVGNRSGSGTGPGAVNVNAGTLGGKGIITGPVTLGTGSGGGAFLAPSVGANTLAKLTIQSALTFKADSTYTYKLNTKRAGADQVIANGVTIESGAQFSFTPVANKRLTVGTVFAAISNTSANPITGTFANLPDGSTLTVGRNNYQVSYSGGDGNDLALTVVP
jgi:autotransporter-associated beta strand protein